MYDQLGGGFHRYATDRTWTVPHFEKMLYDNAEIPRALLYAYQLTDEERFATAAEESLDFVQSELTHDDGGFYSTLDAQSVGEGGEREEGAYYVWTREEIDELIDTSTDASIFCDRYGINQTGNFEDKFVLTLNASIDQLARTYQLDESEIAESLEQSRETVLDARDQRPRPPRDEKILASWNGLAISAFADAALILDDSYAEPAIEALQFLRDTLWDDAEQRLTRRYSDGVAKIDGYLEDYAFLGRGALDFYQATGNVEQLRFAIDLGRAIISEFWDNDAETLYFTPEHSESLIARPQELNDQSTPSSLGVAVELLSTLDHFVTDEAMGDVAARAVDTHGSRIRTNPLQHASLALGADSVMNGALELTLVTDTLPEEWQQTLAEEYISPRLLSRRPADEDTFETWLDALGLETAPPLWNNRDPIEDKPTVYACRSFTCSPPRTEIDAALGWADRMLNY
jgi:uncharacterized protein YyaL (SSP411 family)